MGRYVLVLLILFSGSLSFATLEARITIRAFTETDLEKLMADSKPELRHGIIYLWSPHMPYSVKGIETLKTISHDLKVPLTLLVDSSASLEAIAEIVRQNKIRTDDLRSLRLDMLSDDHRERLTYVHFPTLFFYKNGKLSDNGLPGYLNEEAYRLRINEALAP